MFPIPLKVGYTLSAGLMVSVPIVSAAALLNVPPLKVTVEKLVANVGDNVSTPALTLNAVAVTAPFRLVVAPLFVSVVAATLPVTVLVPPLKVTLPIPLTEAVALVRLLVPPVKLVEPLLAMVLL